MLANHVHASNALLVTGIECSQLRHDIASEITPGLLRSGVACELILQDIMDLTALPANTTHTIAFDLVFPTRLVRHIEKLQRQIRSLQIVVTCCGRDVYDEGFWDLVDTCPMRMRGSGSGFTWSLYTRA